MNAAAILESDGKRYAMEAMRLDRQGSKGMAITYYQKAIESFMRLVKLDPNYELNRIYIQKAMEYQERIKVLKWGMQQTRDDSEPEISPASQPWRAQPPLRSRGRRYSNRRLGFMTSCS
jgi:tetratricopeptide (TPR) repeat protein